MIAVFGVSLGLTACGKAKVTVETDGDEKTNETDGGGSSQTQTYTVTWKNYDGTVLEIDTGVAKDTTPTYDFETPAKMPDTYYQYTFSGWTPTVAPVTADITYTARFTQSIRRYTVTFNSNGGSAVAPVETNDQMTITLPADPTRYGHIFGGWFFDNGIWLNQIVTNAIINTNITVYAKWTSQIVETDFTYTVSAGNATITTFTNTTATVVYVPEVIDDYPVTAIGNNIFKNNTALRRVFLPDGLLSIGSSAFYGCTGITDITIPNSVTSIGSSAFSGCTGLTSITIPDSVTSIDGYAFSGCIGLTNITVGSGNTRYRNENNCLIEIATNTLIWGCKTSIIPDGVTSIGSGAFSGCTGLTSITIPDGVTSIGDSAFYGCTGLTSITIPDGVTSIGDSAFFGCTGLTSITIPDSVTSIGGYAFYYCTGLTIYAEAASKPSGWNSVWNFSGRPVVWGYTE